MATSNPDFPSYQRSTPPPYEEPRREHGCFFYGCIIAGILSLLLLIGIGVALFFFYRWAGRLIEEYTATVPRELPAVSMPAERRKTLEERVEAFRTAVKEGKPTEPLVLDSDELNVLLDKNEELKGKVYVSIDDDKLKGQISIPLEKLPMFGLTKGRYLNGEAELEASLDHGVLIVTLESIEVNGKTVPPEVMAQIRTQNMAKDVYKDAKTAEEIRKLDTIRVKDGKLTITARDRARGPEDDKGGEPARIEARDGKAIAHPPHETPAPGSSAPTGKKLPEDVLAPPGPPPHAARKPSD